MPAPDRLSDLLEPEPDASTPESRAARLRLSLQMADAGIGMMRQNLRRRDPEAAEAKIEAQLATWLLQRPGAEHGEAWGRPAPERFADL